VVSVGFLAAIHFFGDGATSIDLGFWRSPSLGIFYYILMIPVIIYLTNAVNLTDGVDGLCGSVTFVAMLIFTVCCSILKQNEMTCFTMALAGGCLGFLLWNLNPAKCFMGDTGSMFLGAAVTGMGLILHKHLLLLLVALVYIIEALSVVIQVSYFKYTKKKYGEGRRIFKMTPIHHHFEMSGFSEYKIVITFSLFGIIFGVLGIITLLVF
jgi:phospho-N-acetylmuramoyl-pentapeptide-transferase